MKSIFHTAVVFEWNQVFCVELEFKNGKYILNALGSYNSNINTDDTALLLKSDESKNIITKELSKFLSNIKCKSKHISFGLNSSMMFVSPIPIEPTLSRNEKIEHVTWELYQHFNHTESVNYASDLFITEENNNPSFQQTITVSIRQDLLNFFSDVAIGCNKELHIINVDHFGAEQAFLRNYSGDSLKLIMILNFDEESSDISIMKNGSPINTLTVKNNSDIFSKINDLVEKYKLAKIFLHGRGLTQQFHELIKSKSKIEVQLLDPFQTIEIPKQFLEQTDTIEKRHKFTSTLGLALRMPS